MTKFSLLAGVALTALTAPAFAQEEFATGAAITGAENVNKVVTDVQDDVRDDFKRSNDAYRFGAPNARDGVTGSVSLSYSGDTGNKKGQDFLMAGRVTHVQGQFAQNVGIALEFTENDDGDKDAQKVYTVYDAMYTFNNNMYAFAIGRLEQNQLAEGADKKRDGFLGFGPGYRIVNNNDTAWRVQAGVGVRYTQTADQSAADESTTETGYILSSRFYHRYNDMIVLTNDTDLLDSKDAGRTITNELGVNFKMTDAFSTRVSYRTEYQSEREIRSNNRLGVALVYGF